MYVWRAPICTQGGFKLMLNSTNAWIYSTQTLKLIYFELKEPLAAVGLTSVGRSSDSSDFLVALLAVFNSFSVDYRLDGQLFSYLHPVPLTRTQSRLEQAERFTGLWLIGPIRSPLQWFLHMYVLVVLHSACQRYITSCSRDSSPWLHVNVLLSSSGRCSLPVQWTV